MNQDELQAAIHLLTTDQREHIEVYTEPLRGDELPIGTRIRISDPMMSFYGDRGTIKAYHQPPRGWDDWYWVLFDGASLHTKIHREKFEVIE